MSKAPAWAGVAQQNSVGKKLGEESHPVSAPVKQAKKAGRPKSLIQRKKVLLNMSEAQDLNLTILEGQLKSARVPISRGRSETVELALSLLGVMLHSEDKRAFALSVINDYVGLEEKMLESEM